MIPCHACCWLSIGVTCLSVIACARFISLVVIAFVTVIYVYSMMLTFVHLLWWVISIVLITSVGVIKSNYWFVIFGSCVIQ